MLEPLTTTIHTYQIQTEDLAHSVSVQACCRYEYLGGSSFVDNVAAKSWNAGVVVAASGRVELYPAVFLEVN